ncbi:hypothetical protein DYB35_000205 [Aphanomyces astaci]|uniref:Uncharacterized protein n=1 Tax=Aphanomyces astaci TaxID=112090 RepID=A0A3R6X7A0_APHAT|nr:hypothetical protein DYB35_000205 [Aphanomyces astaci]
MSDRFEILEETSHVPEKAAKEVEPNDDDHDLNELMDELSVETKDVKKASEAKEQGNEYVYEAIACEFTCAVVWCRFFKADVKAVLEIDATIPSAIDAEKRLSAVVAERQEKMKAEMLDKLKGFGNTILGKFGLSTDNFQMVQDPTTGSYNINFSQTKKP